MNALKELVLSTRPEQYHHSVVLGDRIRKLNRGYWLASGIHEERSYELVAAHTFPVGALGLALRTFRKDLYHIKAQITEDIPGVIGDPVPSIRNNFDVNILNGLAVASVQSAAFLPIEPVHRNLGNAWQHITSDTSVMPLDRVAWILNNVEFQPLQK